MSLSEKDAKLIESSYRLLYNLQKKNLTFFNALDEYEKTRSGDTGKPPRLAFIVTPLMVNHYNHMHHVYRASLYNRVPDLCDQTGGILCTDLTALREELATRTIDVNRPLTTSIRTATLPNVRFNFKAERDSVVETAVRLLDSIDLKQPDLAHSIRDDYIQNVRAIQESLTNALEKSKERSTELQYRLGEVTRKLETAEKIIASAPDDTDRLRKEVFRLKEQMLKQQSVALRQRVECDTNALRLKERESECNLLRELTKRVDEQTKEGDEGMRRLRADMHEYMEAEIGKLRADYDVIRHEIADHVKHTITRTQKENTETIELCRSLMSRDASSAGDQDGRLSKLQLDYHMLERENAELKRQLARKQHTLDHDHVSGDDGSSGAMEYETDSHNEYVNTVVTANMEDVKRQCSAVLEHREAEFEKAFAVLRADLDSLHAFFIDPNNMEATLRLGAYLLDHGIELNSEYGSLAKYLLQIRNSGSLTGDQLSRIEDLNNKISYAEQIVQDQSSQIECLNRTVGFSNNVVFDLVRVAESAYEDLVGLLGLQRFTTEIVQPNTLNKFFLQRFGTALKDKITYLLQQFKETVDRMKALEKEHEDLKAVAAVVSNYTGPPSPPVVDSETILNSFDGDPTVFERVLQIVWARPETDRLRVVLNAAYYALALERVTRYESYTANSDLKLYNLVEYTTLTNYLRNTAETPAVRSELMNPRLGEPQFFLEYFINQIGNIQVENYINTLQLNRRNELAVVLFNDYYVPIVNKTSFIMSIDGPFANFNMIYKA